MGNFAENLNLGNRFRPPLCFYFPKIWVLLCVVQLKEKKMIPENWKIQHINIYAWYSHRKKVKFTTEV